jgi:hypothetical protein
MRNIVVKEALAEHENEEVNRAHKVGSRRLRNKPKNVPVSAFFCKIVSVDEQPVIFDPNTFRLTSNCRKTNGFFTITYNPEGSPKHVRGKPYTIGQDLVPGRFCVSGVRHWRALCDRIPEFGWMLKWSYYDDGLFDVAKKHPGVAFGFNIKWAEYAKMIEDKAEKMGIDIDHKPYFVYITKKEKLDELKKKFTMMPGPTCLDYQSVLDEVDKEMK